MKIKKRCKSKRLKCTDLHGFAGFAKYEIKSKK